MLNEMTHLALPRPRRTVYTPPNLDLLRVVAHDGQTVQAQGAHGDPITVALENAFVLPTERDGHGLVYLVLPYQSALADLEGELRRVGSYRTHLAERGADAPNPLTPTVIAIPDPADDDPPTAISLWDVPGDNPQLPLRRLDIVGHTDTTVVLADGTQLPQRGLFVCPDDATWERVRAQQAAVVAARDRLRERVEALVSGREAANGTGTPAPVTDPSPTSRPNGTDTDTPAPVPVPAQDETMLPLACLRLDGGTQPRVALDQQTVEEYAQDMRDGLWLWARQRDPIVVYYDGSSHFLASGFHRVTAARAVGLTEIPCEVRQGTQAEAQWFSLGTNRNHGLRRTNDDKQQAVKAALRHPKGAGMSDRAIACHVGVDHKMVGRWRSELERRGEMPHVSTRVDTIGRTYQVEHIGPTNPGSSSKETITSEIPKSSEPSDSNNPINPTRQPDSIADTDAPVPAEPSQPSVRAAMGQDMGMQEVVEREAAAQDTPPDLAAGGWGIVCDDDSDLAAQVAAANADLPDDLAAVGWRLVSQNGRTWMARHSSAVRTGWCLSPEVAIESAYDLRAAARRLSAGGWSVTYNHDTQEYTATRGHQVVQAGCLEDLADNAEQARADDDGRGVAWDFLRTMRSQPVEDELLATALAHLERLCRLVGEGEAA